MLLLLAVDAQDYSSSKMGVVDTNCGNKIHLDTRPDVSLDPPLTKSKFQPEQVLENYCKASLLAGQLSTKFHLCVLVRFIIKTTVDEATQIFAVEI